VDDAAAASDAFAEAAMSVRGIRAREAAIAAWRHDYERKAVPPNAGDDWEKVARIETALLYEADPTNRSLLRHELTRLRQVLT
jgi:hypothetical protein